MKDKKKVIKEITLGVSISVISFLAINYKNTKEQPFKLKNERKPSSVLTLKKSPKKSKKKEVSRIKHIKTDKKSIYQIKNEVKTLEAYKNMVKYPSYSTPINKKQKIDFIEKQLKPDIKMALGEKNPLIQFKAWSEKNFYNENDRIKINAVLTMKGESQNSKITAEFDSGIRKELSLTDNGHYELVIDPKDVNSGKNSVKIFANFKDEIFVMLSRFNYSKSNIELLENKNAELDSHGNLVFKNQAKVKTKGNYLIEGILYHNGKMIAKAHSIKSFTEGKNTIDLKYYGYLFYENQLSGSFELKNLQVSLMDENLGSKSIEFFTPNLKTKEYYWDQFNSSPYNNEIIQDKITALSN